MGYLDVIKENGSLKQFGPDERKQLCQQLRQRILDTVSVYGGHLAPNLGVVETTVALHTVFRSPVDKIIWDVGHQAYSHKLLTGREEVFDTIRQRGGISGFPRIRESEHDPFGTGHSSTSISAALGMAAARDISGDNYSIVAVIGDGALTGGMAFEGLNYAGYTQKDILIILNDNKMSIALNTGALSNYTRRITRTKRYQDVRHTINSLLDNYDIPELKNLKEELKELARPGIVFEKLGLNYFGPVDGHDTEELIDTIRTASRMKGPKLVHVNTTKGKGYDKAEENATKFHGIGPFSKTNGEKHKKSGKSYTDAFSDALCKAAGEDPRIVAITAAMPDGTGLKAFAERFPDRFFDVGIAEQHAVTFAAGLARQGYKPVVAIYSTFLQRAYDQIIHDVCLQELPVLFAIDRAGIVGEDGPTHHGQFDLSFLRSVPGLTVCAPKGLGELQEMLGHCLGHGGPVALRYPKGTGPEWPGDISTPVRMGKCEVLREGDDIVLAGIGSMVSQCYRAADVLANEGIQASVINARFVKPLDPELIRRVDSCGKAVIAEENTHIGGLYGAVSEACQGAFASVGLADTFIEHGTADELRAYAGLSVEDVVRRAKELIKR